jgi:hypothetical protein
MRRTLAAAAASFFVTTAISIDASAAATLINNLGGPLGYGTSTNCVPPNDDGAWPQDTTGLDITPAFPAGLQFYSGTWQRGWVDTNGNFAFRGAVSTYTPNAFPGAQNPMIAPFWADVDTRAPSWCAYPSGGTFPAGSTCQSVYGNNGPASNGIWWDIRAGQVVITWDHVGYFNCHQDKTMTFQMILSSNTCGGTVDGGAGTNFDIEFRYNQCAWETGDASGGSGGFGGTQAVAGFDSGDGTHFAMIPGSKAAGIAMALCNGSNLTPPQTGIWRWSVRGGQVTCPNAGKPCTVTGAKGICTQGQIECTASDGGFGTETCVPLVGPQPTKCNGLDNNCDGTIDTGPCPGGEVCVGAACVPACIEGACPAGTTCSDTTAGKVCVETACIGKMCPVGQRCKGGMCVDDCSGVTCPIGQVCRVGTCVDPCDGLNCGSGLVCENGACVPTCPCRACDTGKACTSSGKCVDSGCENKTCAAGQVCVAGTCKDACTGAVCPTGETCKVGQCTPLPPAGDGGKDGGIILPPPPDDGGSSGVDGSFGDDGGGNADGGGPDGFGDQGTKGGCGCRTASGGDENALALTLGIGALALFVGRRKRARK